MTPSLEGLPTKAKEAPSPREIRLAPLETSPVFQNLGVNQQIQKNQFLWSPINSKIFSHMISSPTLYQEKFSTAKTKTKNWWIRNRHSKKNKNRMIYQRIIREEQWKKPLKSWYLWFNLSLLLMRLWATYVA